MKGLTLTDVAADVGGVEWDGKKYDDHLERKDEWEAVSRLLGREGFGTAPVFSEGGWRLRGMGGGIMRQLSERVHGRHTRTSGKSVSSIVWAARLEWRGCT
jgi:hypothetical protein